LGKTKKINIGSLDKTIKYSNTQKYQFILSNFKFCELKGRCSGNSSDLKHLTHFTGRICAHSFRTGIDRSGLESYLFFLNIISSCA